MGTKQEVKVFMVTENTTGERKVAICSESTGAVVIVNLPELLTLQDKINHAIAYINEHGTHITESVPEGAVRR